SFSALCTPIIRPCVDAVIVLTQTPAVRTVSAGQEVVLSCNIQRYDSNYVSWYKQVPGGVPQYVLRFHHSGSSSSDVDYQFIIKRAEAGDSARYFCQTWDDSADAAVSHDSHRTKLSVTSSSLSPPVLTVFPPSSAELLSNKASLVCLSSQSVPFADVTWLVGGSPVSSGISTSTVVHQPDQTFQISSYLSIQTSDWNADKIYTCKVSLGSQTSEKHIKKSVCSTGE
uniref:Ig-like domain-containing protein n=1 Tax=Scophthalmus maximus TaxID=52904 RepID=A0A8D3CBF1_SCOMX